MPLLEVSPVDTAGIGATLGIDLASQPARTSVCRIDWAVGTAHASLVDGQAFTDACLLELISEKTVTKIGIDAPFGWPDPFVVALDRYRTTGEWPIAPGGYDDQRALVLRETDRHIAAVTGRQPLSVSTDLIAFAAMRCARLLSAIATSDEPINRGGTGRLVEVYPEAALRSWALSPAQNREDPGGYKGNAPAAARRRAHLVSTLSERTGHWLTIPDELIERCRASDDQLDALLCALIARVAEKGMCSLPLSDQIESAAREGWILLPDPSSLSAALTM